MTDNPQDPTSKLSFYERCFICKQNTFVPTNQQINSRKFYIESIGQLCSSCYHSANNVSLTYNIDIDEMYDYFTYEQT